MHALVPAALALAFAPLAGRAVAQEAAVSAPAEPAPADAPPVDRASVTRHAVTIAGEEVAYVARAGTLVLREEDGTPKVEVFHVAYERERDGEDDAARPLAFVFNGGPGSSSVWLHLGVLGPRRVELSEDGLAPPPPYRLVDNGHSLLDLVDLVFVDPPTTGYSRAAPGEDPAQFHGLDEDVRWIGEFVRLYLTRHGRWDSPKLLVGESYGTTRAAALASHLQDRHGIYLNGLVLVSAILSFQTARFDTGNDLPYLLFLPTYTAVAAYHGRLAPELAGDLDATLAEAEAFALGDYALALLQGDGLPEDERRRTAERLARYTGLSADYVLDADLRIRIHRFVKELLRDEGRTVGRLDARYLGIDRDAAGETYEFDPSYAAIQGPYTGALNAYLREELGFESDLPYEILTDRVHPWSYERAKNRYVDVAEDLRRAMTRNPALRVHVASGIHDLATPYFATEYTLDHLGLDPVLRDNVSTSRYEAGHMMYVHLPSLRRFREEVGAFVVEACGLDRPAPGAAPGPGGW